jgi:hypothetical protein
VGRHHEVSTFVAGVGVPPEAFIDMLRPLAIDDSPDGVVVRPQKGSGARADNLLGANSRSVLLANETTATSIVSDRADDARMASFVESVRLELR